MKMPKDGLKSSNPFNPCAKNAPSTQLRLQFLAHG